ncbi:hypothetical protein BDN71DRAFT_1510406 [Pleurotus eryngii]|uniref:Uncharacterized protein n=1 Tax=Pleurotus eryngii TaxID=5323 RepID=A0A9P6DDI1_PLEER|nr:hypothetical protein BDN71DRAFT_1510406 [Pleurotus eryngii]
MQAAELQEKRNSLACRIELWHAEQAEYMPNTGFDATEHQLDVSPENEALLLPSGVPYSSAIESLHSKETRLRVAQADDSLVELQCLLRITAGLANFKYTQVTLTAKQYRTAHTALLALEPQGSWITRLQDLQPSNVRWLSQDLEEHESSCEISWIWRTGSSRATIVTPTTTSSLSTTPNSTPSVELDGVASSVTGDLFTASTLEIGEALRVEATAFRDTVILQQWHNAAMTAHELTTIVDQGIDFDSEGNPWECVPEEPKREPKPPGYKHTYAPPPTTGRHIAEDDDFPSNGLSTNNHPGSDQGPPQDRRSSQERQYPSLWDDTECHPCKEKRVEFDYDRISKCDGAREPHISHRDMGMASALDQLDISGYSRTIRQRYADMIHKWLGQPFELPPGTKLPSHMQKPDRWSGDADVDKFNRWLHSLMRWLRINQYSVPAREEECITMIRIHLDSEATVWFDEEVEDADDDQHWTFLCVVIGLYDQFMQPTAIQDAMEEFLSTKYSATTGVCGFLDALEHTAKCMIHPPDAYMFR